MKKLLLTAATVAFMTPAMAGEPHAWNGTKEDCDNANDLSRNTAAWYDVCGTLRNEIRTRLEGNE